MYDVSCSESLSVTNSITVLLLILLPCHGDPKQKPGAFVLIMNLWVLWGLCWEALLNSIPVKQLQTAE